MKFCNWFFYFSLVKFINQPSFSSSWEGRLFSVSHLDPSSFKSRTFPGSWFKRSRFSPPDDHHLLISLQTIQSILSSQKNYHHFEPNSLLLISNPLLKPKILQFFSHFLVPFLEYSEQSMPSTGPVTSARPVLGPGGNRARSPAPPPEKRQPLAKPQSPDPAGRRNVGSTRRPGSSSASDSSGSLSPVRPRNLHPPATRRRTSPAPAVPVLPAIVGERKSCAWITPQSGMMMSTKKEQTLAVLECSSSVSALKMVVFVWLISWQTHFTFRSTTRNGGYLRGTTRSCLSC